MSKYSLLIVAMMSIILLTSCIAHNEVKETTVKQQLTPSAESDKALNITGRIAKRKLISYVVPIYPRKLEEMGVECTVVCTIVVTPAGDVQSVELYDSSGYEEADANAVEALKKFKFEPLPNEEGERNQGGSIQFNFRFAR